MTRSRAFTTFATVVAAVSIVILAACNKTAPTKVGELTTINDAPFACATIRVTHTGGQQSVSNVSVGGSAKFPHIGYGEFEAKCFDASGKEIAGAKGTMDKDAVTVTIR